MINCNFAHLNNNVRIMFRGNLIIGFFKSIAKQTIKTGWVLLKIMIPISIAVKIIQELNVLPYIGKALAPLMNLVGLPGETGLVWASALIVNIYGGIITYLSLASSIQLTTAQLTVLLTLILVAHTFPIELQIAHKAGIKTGVMFAIRFGFALLLGFILYKCYQWFDLYQTIAPIPQIIPQKSSSLVDWGLNEIQNYATIFAFIFALLFILEIFKITHLLDLINKLLHPILKGLGIGKEVLPITLIGLTLGISYGGAIIIKEAKEGKASRRDVFYAMVLMGLCHSLIEDSILMIAMGGAISGVLFARVLFALIISWSIVKLTKNMSIYRFEKWFLVNIKKR